MSTFWIVGIVLNVSFTGLILYWLIKQAKPRAKSDTPDAEIATPSPAETATQPRTVDESEAK